jgi:hypothetical protein
MRYLVSVSFLVQRWHLLAVSSHGRRDEGAVSGLFHQSTNPLHGAVYTFSLLGSFEVI